MSLDKFKQLVSNQLAFDWSERQKLQRQVLAKAAGLDESYDVGTYPAKPTSNVVINNGSGLVKTALMTAALMGGGAGLGAYAISALTNSTPPATPQPETPQPGQPGPNIQTPPSIFDWKLDSRVIPPAP